MDRGLQFDDANETDDYTYIVIVRSEWKEVNPSDFVAKVLRLGCACKHLADSHAEKRQLLLKDRIKVKFLRWKSKEKPGYDWDAHKRLLGIDVKEMRRIYGVDDSSLDDETVEDVLALDALVVVFILMLYFGSRRDYIHQRFFDRIFGGLRLKGLKIHISRDLFLLEQQLPMSLLYKTMHTLVSGGTEEDMTNHLRGAIANLLFWMYPFKKNVNAPGDELATAIYGNLHELLEHPHLLDCLFQIMKPPICYPYTGVEVTDDFNVVSTHQVPSVSELRKAGIRLKSRAGGIGKFQFEHGVLWLPQLSLYDHTTSVLRNLAAFEAHLYGLPVYIGPYLVLLGNLAQSEQDVELLIKNDVIVNCVCSNCEIKKMLNGLSTNMPEDFDRRWRDMVGRIQEYYKSKRHTLMNEFKQTYWSKPWVIASTTTAALLLFMTFLQTIYTVMSFYHQPS